MTVAQLTVLWEYHEEARRRAERGDQPVERRQASMADLSQWLGVPIETVRG